MIIAFDGNVFSGKTALARALARAIDADVVAEHSDCVDLHGASDTRTVHDRYINTEVMRAKRHAGSRKSIILDRSAVSLCAHAYATYRLGGEDLRRRTITRLRAMADDDTIIIPDVLFHTVCSHATIISRWNDSGGAICAKNTAAALLTKEYQAHIDYFVQQCVSALGGVQICTDLSFDTCVYCCAQHIFENACSDKTDRGSSDREAKTDRFVTALERAMEDG